MALSPHPLPTNAYRVAHSGSIAPRPARHAARDDPIPARPASRRIPPPRPPLIDRVLGLSAASAWAAHRTMVLGSLVGCNLAIGVSWAGVDQPPCTALWWFAALIVLFIAVDVVSARGREIDERILLALPLATIAACSALVAFVSPL